MAKQAPPPVTAQAEEAFKPKVPIKPLGESDYQFSPHLYNHFGLNDIDRFSENINQNLETIIKWTGSDDLGEAIYKIRQLELQLGQPPNGMTRIKQLYNWAKINSQISELKSIRGAYANPGKQ